MPNKMKWRAKRVAIDNDNDEDDDDVGHLADEASMDNGK